jgi:DNA-binding MarR family transcriptional regulator
MGHHNLTPKGRKIRGRFAHLPRAAMDHQAVATLSHAQFRVLVLMAGQYNGKNNGALGLTAKQAAQQGIASERTFYRALRELEERGLIERTFPASRIPPRPTMYALTWRDVDDTEYTVQQAPPKNSYRKWGGPEN